ncbi:MAG: hypothetical protein AMXMBFR13_25880 [Phycisphaerae bacterium]
MNEIETMLAFYGSSRQRTLGLLQQIEEHSDPTAILAWRPGPGRAHPAWQFMHVAITEELFSSVRLIPGSQVTWPDLVPRFGGGSTPDDDIPSIAQIRETLNLSRAHLESTLSGLGIEQLEEVPPPLTERGWTLRTTLQVLGWHEAHHQGQVHLTFNLWKAAHGLL